MTTIEIRGLVKRYRSTLAVDGLTFDVRPGTVTGFLGPNGAGKSTTMRMIVGLDEPSGGSVTVNGKHYAEHTAPLQEVDMWLDTFRRFWNQRLDSLATDLARGRHERRLAAAPTDAPKEDHTP